MSAPLSSYEDIVMIVTLPESLSEAEADCIGKALRRYSDESGAEILSDFGPALSIATTGGGEEGRAYHSESVRSLVEETIAAMVKPSLPFDTSVEDGIRYAITIRVF